MTPPISPNRGGSGLYAKPLNTAIERVFGPHRLGQIAGSFMQKNDEKVPCLLAVLLALLVRRANNFCVKSSGLAVAFHEQNENQNLNTACDQIRWNTANINLENNLTTRQELKPQNVIGWTLV
jgi:hypothetical protein